MIFVYSAVGVRRSDNSISNHFGVVEAPDWVTAVAVGRKAFMEGNPDDEIIILEAIETDLKKGN